MIDIEQQLGDLFQSRADSARPEPDLEAVTRLLARVHMRSNNASPTNPRWKLRVAAIMLIATTSIGVVLLTNRDVRSPTSPGFRPAPTLVTDPEETAAPITNTPGPVPTSPGLTYPQERPSAPLATLNQVAGVTFGALEDQGTALREVQTDVGDQPLFQGDNVDIPNDSPWKSWGSNGRVITDTDATTPAGVYIATCCDPGGVIWRNGIKEVAGTHIDYVLDVHRAVRATVDPATSTVQIGAFSVAESGAIDVALLSVNEAAVLVDEPASLVILRSDRWLANEALQRHVIALPGQTDNYPCAAAALDGRVVLLVGHAFGSETCVGELGIVIDPSSAAVTSTFRFPSQVRGINSDHRSHVVAVTRGGNVVLGDFTSDPSWITLLEGNYLSAYMW